MLFREIPCKHFQKLSRTASLLKVRQEGLKSKPECQIQEAHLMGQKSIEAMEQQKRRLRNTNTRIIMKTNKGLTGYAFFDMGAGATEFWGHPGASLAGTGNGKLHHTNNKTFHTFKRKLEKNNNLQIDSTTCSRHIYLLTCSFCRFTTIEESTTEAFIVAENKDKRRRSAL